MADAASWDTEHLIGWAYGNSITTLAEKAAAYLVRQDTPMAVCMSDKGRIVMDVAEEADEEELIGVYDPAIGMFEAYRQIRDNLRAEADRLLAIIARLEAEAPTDNGENHVQ